MKPDDLSGIYKESRGIKILDKNGNIVDHAFEWGEASNSLRGATINVKTRLKKLHDTGKSDGIEARLLQEKLSELSRAKDLYTDLAKEPRCQIETSKLKN